MSDLKFIDGPITDEQAQSLMICAKLGHTTTPAVLVALLEERGAALFQLAALREELAIANGQRDVWKSLSKKMFLTKVNAYERLADAEQRNADDLRDAERYRGARKLTPYRFKKMQDASVTDGGDVLYFHADRFDALMDIELTKPTESGASE